jgi:hypothetical protein
MMTLREPGRAVAAGSNADPRHRSFAALCVKLVLPMTPRAA